MSKRMIVFGLISMLLLTAVVPIVYASTLTVTVYPQQNQARIQTVSNTQIIFKYPANSKIGQHLSGMNFSSTFTVNITHGASALAFFEGCLRSRYTNITVENMSVSMTLNAHANSTTLEITKTLNIVVWVSGIFNRTKNHTIANMSWKNFAVNGKFEVNAHGKTIYINEIGNTMKQMMGENMLFMMIATMFEHKSIWSKSTIDFSMLSVPLNKWDRSYNPSTNMTTFTYVYKKVLNFNAQVSFNGKVFSLTVTYDPSATINTPGYATAEGNNIVISSTPPPTTIVPSSIIAVVVLVIIIGSIVGVLAYKKRH